MIRAGLSVLPQSSCVSWPPEAENFRALHDQRLAAGPRQGLSPCPEKSADTFSHTFNREIFIDSE